MIEKCAAGYKITGDICQYCGATMDDSCGLKVKCSFKADRQWNNQDCLTPDKCGVDGEYCVLDRVVIAARQRVINRDGTYAAPVPGTHPQEMGSDNPLGVSAGLPSQIPDYEETPPEIEILNKYAPPQSVTVKDGSRRPAMMGRDVPWEPEHKEATRRWTQEMEQQARMQNHLARQVRYDPIANVYVSLSSPRGQEIEHRGLYAPTEQEAKRLEDYARNRYVANPFDQIAKAHDEYAPAIEREQKREKRRDRLEWIIGVGMTVAGIILCGIGVAAYWY